MSDNPTKLKNSLFAQRVEFLILEPGG